MSIIFGFIFWAIIIAGAIAVVTAIALVIAFFGKKRRVGGDCSSQESLRRRLLSRSWDAWRSSISVSH